MTKIYEIKPTTIITKKLKEEAGAVYSDRNRTVRFILMKTHREISINYAR